MAAVSLVSDKRIAHETCSDVKLVLLFLAYVNHIILLSI